MFTNISGGYVTPNGNVVMTDGSSGVITPNGNPIITSGQNPPVNSNPSLYDILKKISERDRFY